MSEQQTERVILPDKDGYLIVEVNPETGEHEIVGHVERDKTFEVSDIPSADWVVERMQECDAAIVGIDALLAARTTPILREKAGYERKRAWLQARYGKGLEQIMREHYATTDKTSLVLPCGGKLKLNHSEGGISVLDKDRAIAFCKRAKLKDALQTITTVLVSMLKGHEKKLPSDAFQVIEPHKNFAIDTGIEKSKGGKRK